MPATENNFTKVNGALIAVAITVLALLPFVNKAFHIDDPLFLWSAKHILTDPANFYGFTVNWFGGEVPMAAVMKNPPLACYYIALAALLFGWSEVSLHLAFLIPAAAVAMGTYYLAKRLCSRPLFAALATVLTPVFLISSTNIMCDTMMLAFWVWAVFFWLKGIDNSSRSNLFVSALLIALCTMTKYFGISLLALLPVYAVVRQKKLRDWIFFLLIPVMILAGYQAYTHVLYIRGLLNDATVYAVLVRGHSPSELFSFGLIGLTFTGGCLLAAFFYSPFLWPRRLFLIILLLAILCTCPVFFLKSLNAYFISKTGATDWPLILQFALMAFAGISVLLLAFADFRKHKDAPSVLLLLWVIGTFLFAAFVNWVVNGRSILPIAPAVGILLMRRIDAIGSTSKRASRQASALSKPPKQSLLVAPLILTGIVAIAATSADYSLANISRTAAETIRKQFGNGQKKVYFEGHWGFQYYMQAEGLTPIDFQFPQVQKGDMVVIPSNNTNTMPLSPQNAEFFTTIKISPFPGLATMDRSAKAGFYCHDRGPLPFAIHKADMENFDIFLIK